MNDKVFRVVISSLGILRPIIRRRSGRVYRVRVIGLHEFLDRNRVFSISIWLERKEMSNWITMKRKELVYFEGVGKKKREDFYCIVLKSVYFFFVTFYTFYSRDIIIRVLLLLRYNTTQDFPVYFLGILNNSWKITKINDRLYPEQSG